MTLDDEIDGVFDLVQALKHELVTIMADEGLDAPRKKKLRRALHQMDRIDANLFGNQPMHPILFQRRKMRRHTRITL